jgi:NAD(P)-dependent dehydrogenase (short-subunit alcohol dehydrogenase family)
LAQQQAPVWFITGCSTGLGRTLAHTALSHGFRVVVTARNTRSIADIVGEHEDRALAISLDVRNSAEITTAVAEAEKQFGGIDVLVNNAGYGYYAAVEEGEDPEIRAVFDTNFFGLAEMIRRVLPGMRKRKSGFIVNITSLGGLVAFVGSGYYAATKFAVEALSEALAKEVSPLGIRVLIVEPGPFRTDFAGRSLKRTARRVDDYAGTVHARVNTLQANSGMQPGDPLRAAEAIIRAVQSSNPPLRLLLGSKAPEFVRAKWDGMQKDMDQWKEITVGADFPE